MRPEGGHRRGAARVLGLLSEHLGALPARIDAARPGLPDAARTLIAEAMAAIRLELARGIEDPDALSPDRDPDG